MKYIKTFEEKNDFLKQNLDLTNRCVYIIYGNINTQRLVIKKLQEKCDKELDKDLSKVLDNLHSDNSIGVILPYNFANLFGFYQFYKEEQICDILFNFYKKSTFKGELKIKNDEIFLDRSKVETLRKQYELEQNTNKYGL